MTLTMTPKELDRIKIISRITAGTLTIAEGATSLSLSERQLYRILHGYRIGGDAALLHKLRGRPSNRGFGTARFTEIIHLYRTHYDDYGPTLFSEMVAQYHNIEISVSTTTRYLRRAGITTAERRKRPHRKKRERRSAIGALVQFDGSDHDWFVRRTPLEKDAASGARCYVPLMMRRDACSYASLVQKMCMRCLSVGACISNATVFRQRFTPTLVPSIKQAIKSKHNTSVRWRHYGSNVSLRILPKPRDASNVRTAHNKTVSSKRYAAKEFPRSTRQIAF